MKRACIISWQLVNLGALIQINTKLEGTNNATNMRRVTEMGSKMLQVSDL